jgi:hypothetical protein
MTPSQAPERTSGLIANKNGTKRQTLITNQLLLERRLSPQDGPAISLDKAER